MRNLIVILISLLCLAPDANAQTYKHTMGIRLAGGTGSRMVGLTSNYRLAKGLSVEGIIQTNFQDNHTGHLLLKRHKGLVSRRFNFYYGAGMSIGSEESYIRNPDTRVKTFTYGNQTWGVDLVGGIEFTLLRLNMSFDVKPNINISGRQNWITFQSGMSIRSVLVTRGQANRKKKQKARERKRREKARAEIALIRTVPKGGELVRHSALLIRDLASHTSPRLSRLSLARRAAGLGDWNAAAHKRAAWFGELFRPLRSPER